MIPERFEYWVRDEDDEQETALVFTAAGDPGSVTATPPFRRKKYAMDIADAAGAVDPATAAAMLTAPRAAACTLAMRVFDGRKLHGVSLTPSPDAASAGTVRCEGLYERLGGFKRKYMTPDRRTYPFTAELKQVAADRWIPMRIWAITKFGPASAVLEE